MSEYYKSLISDDEVIKELIKESKRREGNLPTEVTRLKPNLNFFQRTVNNLVSNNTRIDKSKDTFKTEFLKDCIVQKPDTCDYSLISSPKKANVDYAFERNMVLQTKINFIKSSETFSNSLPKANKKIEIKKIRFISGVTNTSKTHTKHNPVKKSDQKCNKNKKLYTISSVSEDSDSDGDLILMLTDDKNKTTCKSISTSHKGIEVNHKATKLSKNNIICISSDDNSIEIISSDTEDQEKKNKVKTRVRKRKQEKLQDKSVDEFKTKAKRKKRKKNKKEKLKKNNLI